MSDQPHPTAQVSRPCESGADDRPLCPTRRAVLERALALGALPLLGEQALLGDEAQAGARTPKWYSAGAKTKFALNKPVLVKFLRGAAAVFVVKVSATKYVGLWAACTHDGVLLNWDPRHPTIYHCHKHGAEFARNTGKVTHGPAKQPLPSLPVRAIQARVEVDLSVTGLV